MSVTIRQAEEQDREAIQQLYLSAFDANEREVVAALAIDLLDDDSLHIVAEQDEALVGHVSFSPVWNAATKEQIGWILAPLAVHPTNQKQGIGTQLVGAGIEFLKQQQAPLVFVYGDPDYYRRFGFSAELAQNTTAPYPLQFPHGWQALRLTDKTSAATKCTIQCVAALSQPSLW